MLPEGWKYANLGGIISHRKGHPFKSNTYKTHGTRVIRISDTTSNSIHSLNPVFIENSGGVNLDEFALKHGDIILTTVGSKPHLIDSMVGKAVRIPEEIDGALLNQNLVKLSPNDKFIISDILFLYLKSRNFISYISDLVRGNANQVSISLKDIFAYRVLLPPLPEQKKIAAILSTWDCAIEGTEKLLANSQQQKKALMQQLLTGKKRLPGFTGEWKNVTFEKTGKCIRGVTYKPDNLDTPQSYILLRANNIQNGRISYSDVLKVDSIIVKKEKILSEGDIFICMANGSKNLVGKSAYYYRKNSTETVGSFCSIFRTNKSNSSRFVFSLFESTFYRDKIEIILSGTSINNLKPSDIEGMSWFIPPLPEQKAIAAVLTTADEEITAIESDLTRLRQEKKALMQQLLTGKRRVTVS